MSENEIHKGKLKLIHTAPSEDGAYAFLKNLIRETDPSVDDEFDSAWSLKEQISDAIYSSEILEDVYYIVGNKVYEDIDHVELDEYGFDDFKKNEDGTISYLTMFYNGGTCLSEVIESGLKK